MPKALLPIVVLGLLSLIAASKQDKIVIDIYHESLCPFCVRLLHNSVDPAMRKLKDFDRFVELNLYPFGNAAVKKKDNGVIAFGCQHGPEECRGNIVEACAAKKLSKRQAFAYVICLGENRGQPFFQRADQCNEKMNLGNTGDEIKKCAAGYEGAELFLELGTKQKQLQPPVGYVPWILVNGQHNEDQENKVGEDLASFVCQMTKNQIEGCSSVSVNLVAHEEMTCKSGENCTFEAMKAGPLTAQFQTAKVKKLSRRNKVATQTETTAATATTEKTEMPKTAASTKEAIEELHVNPNDLEGLAKVEKATGKVASITSDESSFDIE